jgi:predicted nucleic acid-binding protein
VIVVADTTPLLYLILIEHAHILPSLYGRVLVPPAVVLELTHDQTPSMVREWLTDLPDWLQVRAPREVGNSSVPLGPGEWEAIALAEEVQADALLIDDRDGRQEALRRHLPVIGTLRVLADASDHGFADLGTVLSRLRQTNFRASEELFQWLLTRETEQREP